jgi:FkbM family methyltransferase
MLRVLRLLYGRDPGVSIVPAAVGRAPGTASLLVGRANPSVTTLSRDWAHRVGASRSFRGVRWTVGSRVPVTTLDALIARYGPPQFVKIDVEGYEAEVLAGLSRAVPALSFEYLVAAREQALACLGRLAALGSYRYNWSVGESHRMASSRWLDPGAMRAVLEALPESAGSGDVYARLGPGGNPGRAGDPPSRAG